MEKINKFQTKILNCCKKYLISQKNNKIDISTSPLCFFTVWADTPGYYKLNKIAIKNRNLNKYFVMKNLLSISKNYNLNILFNKKKLPSKKINLIVSYSTKNNFDIRGNFKDDFFDYDSGDTRFFWLLISLDNFIPKKFRENIAIISYKKNFFKYNLIYLLKFLKNLVIDYKLSIKKIKHFCWEESNFSNNISSLSKSLFNQLNINKFVINYEGVPFQNKLIHDIKNKNKNIKTFGYLHCAPWPLQLDLIYKSQPLDELIVSGKQQKIVLKKFLGWNNKKITVIPSLRFEKKKYKEFNGFLFTPYNLDNSENYLKRLEDYLVKMKNNKSINFKIRIHPLNKKSKKHQMFKKNCELILRKYKSKKTVNKINQSLFFGSATGVCIQALEEGTNITHFPNNENLDVFSEKIWPSLKVRKIGEMIYDYKLRRKDQTFLVENKKNKFSKYFLPILQ